MVAVALVPGLLVAVVGAAMAIAVRVARPPPAAQNAALLIEAAREGCQPEPHEMLAYVLGSVAACAALFVFVRFAPKIALVGARGLRPLRTLAACTTVAGTMLLVNADFSRGVKAWRAFNRYDGLVGLAVVALAIVLVRRARRGALVVPRLVGPALGALAALLLADGLLGAIFGEGSIGHAARVVSIHLPFTLGEFAAPAGGRTALVDFHAQYVNLLPLVFSPLIRATRGAVGPFTTLMALLSFAALAGWWAAAKQATGSVLRASLVMLPVVAIATYWPEDGTSLGPDRGMVFNYYALAPLRLFLPGIGMPLVVRAVRVGGRGAWFAAGVVAGLAALNNPDFGLVFAASAFVVAGLFPSANDRPSASLAAVAGGAVAGVAAGLGALALHGGGWPSLRDSLDYQRAFAATGFFMIPLEIKEPLHWVLFATHLGAVATGLFRRASEAPGTRLRGALLVFAGLQGLGTGTYYVGRSHALVMVALFMPWAFSAALLAWEAWCEWRDPAKKPVWLLLPSLLLAFHFGLFLGRARQVPNPAEQLDRLATIEVRRENWFARLEAVLREKVPPGTSTEVVYPDGPVLSLRAGVADRYPFAHPGSLILLSQVDAVAAQIARDAPPHVFGNFPAELAERLTSLGYRKSETVQAEPRLVSLGYPDFEIWTR